MNFQEGFFLGGGGSGHAHGQSSIGTCGRNRLLKSTHKIRGLNKDPFCNTWTVLDHWQTAIGEQSAKATGVKRSKGQAHVYIHLHQFDLILKCNHS